MAGSVTDDILEDNTKYWKWSMFANVVAGDYRK